jgi:hypothetical protein
MPHIVVTRNSLDVISVKWILWAHNSLEYGANIAMGIGWLGSILARARDFSVLQSMKTDS